MLTGFLVFPFGFEAIAVARDSVQEVTDSIESAESDLSVIKIDGTPMDRVNRKELIHRLYDRLDRPLLLLR